MKHNEHILQVAIMNAINYTEHFRAFIIDINPVPTRDRHGKVNGIKSTHATVGVFDIFIACPCSKYYWQEVKLPGKYLSKAQIDWQKKIQAVGGESGVVHSVKESLEMLKEYCDRNGIVDKRLNVILKGLTNG